MTDLATVAPFGSPLTPAERRVIQVMRTADSYEHAARLLGISPNTVRNHLANARSRMGVKTTRQLIVRVAA